MEKRIIRVSVDRLMDLGISLAMIERLNECEIVDSSEGILSIPVVREMLPPGGGMLGLTPEQIMKIKAMMYHPEPEDLYIPDPKPKKRAMRFKSPNWNF